MSVNVEEVRLKVRKVVCENLGKEDADVEDNHHFIDDLGADSLDTVELVMALEEEFDTEIPDEEAEKITTIEKTIDYIKNKAS